MAGIYLHIPFCRQACHYCDFHFSTSLKNKSRLIAALNTELERRAGELNAATVNTVYFGGGTPSLLTETELNGLLETLHARFQVSDTAEITLEANPDDLTTDYLRMLHRAGVNRLSIGIQSFLDDDLQGMHRLHTAEEASACVKRAQEEGFSNITIDLMYGLPHRTVEEWKANVDKALALNVPHISAYCLTIEPRTLFGHRYAKGELQKTPDGIVSAQYHALVNALTAAGFEHYEVSNFAQPGMRSRHNSAYWEGVPYVGVGPGAHSFDGARRAWNVSNNPRYIDLVEKNEAWWEEETLTTRDRLNEYLMTGLRTSKGVEFAQLQALGWNPDAEQSASIEAWTRNAWLVKDAVGMHLTEEGFLMADYIASELFQTDAP